MLARASPRKPYVLIELKSSNAFSLEVVKRSHRIGRSSRYHTQHQHQESSNLCVCTDIDTVAVVSDLQKFESTIFHHYFNRCRASIHGILNELLKGMHGGYYNLACSDLVYHVFVERLPAIVSFIGNRIVQVTYLNSLRSLWGEVRSICLSLGTPRKPCVDIHSLLLCASFGLLILRLFPFWNITPYSLICRRLQGDLTLDFPL